MFIMKRDMRQVHTWHSSWWIFLINIWIGHGNYNVFKVHWLRHIFNTFFCWILWATFISAFLFWFKSSKWALGCAYLRCLCTFRKSCAAYKKFERVKVNFSSSFNFNAITISWLLVFTYSVNCRVGNYLETMTLMLIYFSKWLTLMALKIFHIFFLDLHLCKNSTHVTIKLSSYSNEFITLLFILVMDIHKFA